MAQDLDMGSELPDARAQASTIPTMAAAIPQGAGCAPATSQRSRGGKEDERYFQAAKSEDDAKTTMGGGGRRDGLPAVACETCRP